MHIWKNELDNLHRLVYVENKSYEEIGRIYGCTSTNIRKILKKYGFALPSRRSINPNESKYKQLPTIHKCLNKRCNTNIIGNPKQKYCCNKCQKEHERDLRYEYYLSHQDEFVGKEIPYSWLKVIMLEEQHNRCAICGNINEWNGNELHFIIDHIDGDATNNKRDNLRLICPNCDSQLDTYKSRNKGKSTRKYKPYRIRQ